MRVALRTDASRRIGGGHVSRCLALADALAERGADCHFVTRAHPGHMDARIRAAGHELTSLPAPDTDTTHAGETDYPAWLGLGEEQDSAETLAALSAWQPDWLVVDHYALGERWERAAANAGIRVLAIDDLANRPHAAEVLIDQTLHPSPATRCAGLLAHGCRTLLGPRHALLRGEYRQQRPARPPAPASVQRAFIFFGSVDTANLTGATLTALSQADLADIAVDMVVSDQHARRDEVIAQAHKRPHTTLHTPRPHLADLMAGADLAIGAGGVTAWERCTLGLPAVVIAIAHNQCETCIQLHEQGAITFLGHQQACEHAWEAIARAVHTLRTDGASLATMAGNAWRLCDGLGAARAAEALLATPTDQLRLRPAREEDVVLYHDWVNDPATRAAAFNSEPIDWPTHHDWFHRRLADSATRLRVLETPTGLPVGQARIQHGAESTPHLDYSIDAAFRGRGWGTALLRKILAEWRRDHGDGELIAEIRPDNQASLAALTRAGFERCDATTDRVVLRAPTAIATDIDASPQP